MPLNERQREQLYVGAKIANEKGPDTLVNSGTSSPSLLPALNYASTGSVLSPALLPVIDALTGVS